MTKLLITTEPQRTSSGCEYDMFLGPYDEYDLFVAPRELHADHVPYNTFIAISRMRKPTRVGQHNEHWAAEHLLDDPDHPYQGDYSHALMEAYRRFQLVCPSLLNYWIVRTLKRQAQDKLERERFMEQSAVFPVVTADKISAMKEGASIDFMLVDESPFMNMERVTY